MIKVQKHMKHFVVRYEAYILHDTKSLRNSSLDVFFVDQRLHSVAHMTI